MTAKTDRELLELAAKAAGADFEYDPMTGAIEVLSEIGGVSGIWNPLTDDGDALRLAVKLCLTVDILPWASDARPWKTFGNGDDGVRHEEYADPSAATRRAIVRAAAAIGETL